MAKSSTPEKRLKETWIGLRIFTFGWVLFFSPIRPSTVREMTIPFWPPSQPYSVWLERAALAPWERYDAGTYGAIIRQGYSTQDGTAQFHPLYPLLAKPLAFFFPEPNVALILVASIAYFIALMALYRLARLDFPEATAEVACITFLAFPVSALLFVPYTESLWIACAALALLWSRQRQWLLAAAAVAAATLTRQQGLLLMLPVAWEVWDSHQRRWSYAILRDLRAMTAVLAAPLAYAAWVLYRTFALSDARPDLSSIQGFLYSTLLSKSAFKVVPVQAFLPPWEALYLAVKITIQHPNISNVLNLVLPAVFLLLTGLAWKHLRTSYRWLVAAILVISVGYYTGPTNPYMGLPRHLLLAFPVFIGLAPVLNKGKRSALVNALFLPLNFILLLLYTLEAWVP